MTQTFSRIQTAAALGVSIIAAYFSIIGLIAIFPGAIISVIAMGIALECAKIVTANALVRRWTTMNRAIRAYLVMATIILSLITSLGIFGYLSRAHIEHSVAVGRTEDAVSLVAERIQQTRTSITSDRQVLKQMDDAVTAMMSDTAKVRRAVLLRSEQRAERKKLDEDITQLNATLLTLEQQKAVASNTQRISEVDVGPLKYIAQAIYGKDDPTTTDKAARMLIGTLITVFDPLALLLLISAKHEDPEPLALTPPPVYIPVQPTPPPATPTRLPPPVQLFPQLSVRRPK